MSDKLREALESLVDEWAHEGVRAENHYIEGKNDQRQICMREVRAILAYRDDGWISVKERLPEPGIEVWCWRKWDDRQEIRKARRNSAPLSLNTDASRDCHWEDDVGGLFSDITVAGWAQRWIERAAPPLPEPPKEGK